MSEKDERRAAPRAMGASADERAEFVKQLRSKASMARMAASEIEADYEPDDPADIAAGLEFDAEMNEKAADLIEALLAQPEPSREVEPLSPVHGDVLPRMGERVQIHLASIDKWVGATVVGYYVWPSHGGNKSLHRVNVRVRTDDGCLNARMLCDIRASNEEKK